MLLFDTATLDQRDRADAVSASMIDATLSTDLVHHDPADVWLRISSVDVGAVDLTHVAASGMDTTRTSRRVADDEVPTIALSLGVGRPGVIEQDGLEISTALSTVNLVELTRPYRSRIPRGTAGWSVKIPWTSWRCRPAPSPGPGEHRRQPGARGVRQHLRSLGSEAGHLDAGMGNALLGTATVALARALISSAADEQRLAREAMADTLLLRVQAYVREHLSDPGLTPDAIAAAHHVSVRQLYKTFASSGLSLEQWIIALRLEGARRDLARADSRQRTIAAVGRRWGFPNPSHFTQRFRAAYGMTPREWRALQLEGR